MRLEEQPALPTPAGDYDRTLSQVLQRLLRNVAQKVNQMADGRISAHDNAAAAPPSTGTWATGDIVRNNAPSGLSPTWGWICTAGGTPGTWEALTSGGGSAWANTTPTVTSNTGTITTKSAVVRYTKVGKTVTFQAVITITTNGTGAGWLILPLPFPAAFDSIVNGAEANAGVATVGFIGAGTSVALITKYDGTYPGGSGTSNQLAGTYQTS